MSELLIFDKIVTDIENSLPGLPFSGRAILAGGAIRDWFVGLTPNDYDVYIRHQADKSVEEIVTDLIERLPPEWSDAYIQFGPDEQYGDLNEFKGIINVTLTLNEVVRTVQIMCLTGNISPINYIEQRFDSNLNKSRYLKHYGLRVVEELVEFMKTGIIRLVAPTERAVERAVAFKQRFPEGSGIQIIDDRGITLV